MRSVGALIFPGFELLDLFGPMQLLGLVPDGYDLNLIAQAKGEVRGNPGLGATAAHSLEERSDFDILFIPGGTGTRTEVDNPVLLDWIERASRNAEYILTVCTGSALLARTGVLDGRKATTNKLAYGWATAQGPNVNWQPKARWVEDGMFLTSSGVSAGMDMALAAITCMHGLPQAEQVAGWAEYDWHKDPAWDPFARVHALV